jgi:hypothetical protein
MNYDVWYRFYENKNDDKPKCIKIHNLYDMKNKKHAEETFNEWISKQDFKGTIAKIATGQGKVYPKTSERLQPDKVNINIAPADTTSTDDSPASG